ncbi:MAG: LysM peptidoglycan-binding domain-containing protein [Elusimicrobia bacterium]|nr:LysM peptidoglycan-binding domain-containing protein [Elusimicrobiota bacterium]MBD3412118.1 LysM peptidoglycan-binding domain-containing protein [Elusimicrobiota bacterium]
MGPLWLQNKQHALRMGFMISILMLSVQGIRADFDHIGLGGRPVGLSNAYTALADDIYALYYNPAGLGLMTRPALAAEYGRLHTGLTDNSNLSRSFVGYVHPIRIPRDKERFWKHKVTDPGNLPYRDFGTIGIGLVNFDLVGEYEERALYISYGRRVYPGIYAGVNIKNLYEKYMIDDYLRMDPVFSYGSRDSVQTISIDGGLLYHINSMFSVGFSVLDINQPDTGLKSINRLDRQFRFGGAYRMRSFTSVLDIVRKADDLNIHAGAEQWIFRKMLGFRAGYTEGSRDLRNYTAGLSFNMFDIQLDYAFQFPLSGLKSVDGSHRFSFMFRFGFGSRYELSTDNVEQAFIRIQKEHHQLQEEYHQIRFTKEKLEEKYQSDLSAKEKELEQIKTRAQQLRRELEERPVIRVAPKPKKRPPPPAKYTVQEGDTLRSIAERLYGDPLRWLDLYRTNKDHIERSEVKPGQVLIVPR